MAIEFPALPFALEALEPHMSRRTLEFHHGKHHKKYVDTANKLIAGTEYENLSHEDILLRSFKVDRKIFNNAAQAWNHSFFWQCLKKDTQPSPRLSELLRESFGGVDAFKDQFTEKAGAVFGSGWAWLVKTDVDRLAVRKMPNARNPLVRGEIPLLTCDVWEHAYYLDYQNERPKFLQNFWSIVNWDFVDANLNRKLPKLSAELKEKSPISTPKEFEKARASHH